jgi:hypothetical protein
VSSVPDEEDGNNICNDVVNFSLTLPIPAGSLQGNIIPNAIISEVTTNIQCMFLSFCPQMSSEPFVTALKAGGLHS